MNSTTFNQISIGRKFQVPSKIVYQKTSKDDAIPVLTANKKPIQNGKVTKLFTNSKIQVIPVD